MKTSNPKLTTYAKNSKRQYQVLILVLFLFFNPVILSVFAADDAFIAHYRHRPPEMIINEDGSFSGPLIDIINEASQKLGHNINWYKDDFKNSYECLKKGCVDFVPRVILTDERKAFVNYLGPIGYQQKNIYFLVHKDQEELINSYEDLYNLRIGVKKHTAYFKRFNDDKRLKKLHLNDDANMSKMFMAKRFDTMIVLDVQAIIEALEKHNYKNYTFANYRYEQKIGNYYGMSKKSPRISYYDAYVEQLNKMTQSGRIRDIYQQFGVTPLLNE